MRSCWNLFCSFLPVFSLVKMRQKTRARSQQTNISQSLNSLETSDKLWQQQQSRSINSHKDTQKTKSSINLVRQGPSAARANFPDLRHGPAFYQITKSISYSSLQPTTRSPDDTGKKFIIHNTQTGFCCSCNCGCRMICLLPVNFYGVAVTPALCYQGGSNRKGCKGKG